MQRPTGPLLVLLAAFACVQVATAAPCDDFTVSTVAGDGSSTAEQPRPSIDSEIGGSKQSRSA
jgi:hypothetical protein